MKKINRDRKSEIKEQKGEVRKIMGENKEKNKTIIPLSGKTVFVTGAAGFIGANLVLRLLPQGEDITVIGLDNMNDYYDVKLKEWRLEQIHKAAMSNPKAWKFIRGDIADKEMVDDIFKTYHPEIVVNLAAQAGVRYSITNPDAYIQSNLIGFYHILEACRHSYDNEKTGVEHLVYASSSSVYGGNEKVPFSTEDKVDNPVSLYAATKKSNELMAHAYAKLYNIPSTGLRFFTVYGPAGRPDMAYFGFTDKLRSGEDIQIYNFGNCKRDFTFVDDIVEGVMRVMQGAPVKKTGADGLPLPPYAVYNIGGGHPENLCHTGAAPQGPGAGGTGHPRRGKRGGPVEKKTADRKTEGKKERAQTGAESFPIFILPLSAAESFSPYFCTSQSLPPGPPQSRPPQRFSQN